MLPKGPYDPQKTEEEILNYWNEKNCFAPEYVSNKELATNFGAKADQRESYTNILPPPNANGNLHLGHMSGYAYQDLMGRYQRMKGKRVLLLPGKDHAGIQTEVVFENELQKKKISKRDLGREEFYRQCYDFCMLNSEIARKQEKKLGLSADYSRELFTLDPRIVKEVLQTFIDMYHDNLIYRGKRLINWCVRCQSALADIDTEYKDSKTQFVWFKYGFLQPDPNAVFIKNKYAGVEVEGIVERFKGMEWKSDKGTNYEWEFDYYGELPNEINPADGKNLDVIFLGYETGLKAGVKLRGKAIGLMMRLDGDYKLIVKNDENRDLDIKAEIDALTKRFGRYFAGVHVILFDEYPDDKFYTNGFVIGTVRPETKFGDTAIAVHPDDDRYREFVGKEFEVITLNGTAKLKIIADIAVDRDFGTGALKVTPAHAKEDWDIATRHPEVLPEKQVINFDGTLNHLAGKFAGLKAIEARDAIVEEMKKIGMLVGIDNDYENRIQICERCKHQIEPLISYQWFLKTERLKVEAKRLVEEGMSEIMPTGKQNVYLNWMDQPEDWCITRQLWWGYRVPVWYKSQPQEYIAETGEVKEKIGNKVLEKKEDYADFMRVSITPPGREFFLMRHGQSEANAEDRFCGRHDSPLTDLGKQQAEATAENLRKENFDIILTSTLSRAKETGEIVGKKLGIKVESHEIFIERDFGDFEYMKKSEVVAKYPGTKLDRQETVPGGESISDVDKRVEEMIEFLRANYLGKKILLVSHNGIVRVMRRKLGMETVQSTIDNGMENGEYVRLTIPEPGWEQDEDVFDTWFSSGQWPAVTLLARKGDFEQYYPTQVMETGWDILIFWVTRMMLLCPYKAAKVTKALTTKRLNEDKNNPLGRFDKSMVPFARVYLHGLVLDKNGVKMSKSKGNGIDPFEMMQKFGTDALRLSFVVGNRVGQNYRLYEEKIANFRNFCNKIWNVSKFVIGMIDSENLLVHSFVRPSTGFNEDDNLMLEKIARLVHESTDRMEKFQFGVAASEIYESLWHEFADIYIEKVKTRTYTKDKEGKAINTSDEAQASREAALWTLWKCLDIYLRLLHPFAPFITDRIWQDFPKQEEESELLMYSRWPGENIMDA